MNRLFIFIAVIIVLGVIGWQVTRPPQNPTYEAEIIAPDTEIPSIGFTAIEADYAWDFPADYKPHPTYQREQWQLDLSACYDVPASVTFERISLISDALAPERASEWALHSVIIATLDLPAEQASRYARANVGLAGAAAGTIWLENWSLTWEAERYTLTLDGTAAGTFTRTGEPQTTTASTYYQIEQALAGTWQDRACDVVLMQRFGQQLP